MYTVHTYVRPGMYVHVITNLSRHDNTCHVLYVTLHL